MPFSTSLRVEWYFSAKIKVDLEIAWKPLIAIHDFPHFGTGCQPQSESACKVRGRVSPKVLYLRWMFHGAIFNVLKSLWFEFEAARLRIIDLWTLTTRLTLWVTNFDKSGSTCEVCRRVSPKIFQVEVSSLQERLRMFWRACGSILRLLGWEIWIWEHW